MRRFIAIFVIGVFLIAGQSGVRASASAPEVWFAPNDDLPRGPNRDRIPGPDFQHLFDPTPSWSVRTDVF